MAPQAPNYHNKSLFSLLKRNIDNFSNNYSLIQFFKLVKLNLLQRKSTENFVVYVCNNTQITVEVFRNTYDRCRSLGVTNSRLSCDGSKPEGLVLQEQSEEYAPTTRGGKETQGSRVAQPD